MNLLAENLLNYRKKLYNSAVINYYKLFGYDVIIVKSDLIVNYDGNYITDKFKKGYGSEHSSTYTQNGLTREIKVKLIIPNMLRLSNMYNETAEELYVYYVTKDLLIIGDIVKFNYNNRLYEYKVSEHPITYYDILYKVRLESMYMGAIN